ncbi:LysR family transcriptional regulator [Tateyamaria sp. ANG-S1]|uniref:helix-turn-helix domain-containing protein n=1 Tax=Tateyamaria sp. ANG-S1 TaxID=1577905 RepID=UPI001F4CB7C4|nr:LysR family transcriptional regulator [Tateyamaria sp. ANG-S1]
MNAPTRNLTDVNQPLLFEMMRSFTTLAQTLNLSHAVAELNSTRQTVRRHISQLEEAKQAKLFTVENRRYLLTDAGRKALPEALDILARGTGWLTGQSGQINGLQFLRHEDTSGWCHYQQQHPIARAFSSTGDLLHSVIRAWSMAGGYIEDDAFKDVRPYCTVSRSVNGRWLFTEVGDLSSYVSWFGWKRARSSIGASLGEMPGGSGFGLLVDAAYQEVEATQSMRLDHVYTLFPRGDDGVLSPICYERLLLGGRYPDHSYAMITVVRRTYDVEIHSVTNDMLRLMPEDMLM